MAVYQRCNWWDVDSVEVEGRCGEDVDGSCSGNWGPDRQVRAYEEREGQAPSLAW